MYSVWQRKGKISRGVMSAEVYDPQNRIRVRVLPKKISIPAGMPARYGFSFSPKDLESGSYRVDLLFEGRAIWRTFFTIVD